ncbi:metal ABC transporter permease [Halobacteria archaeon AArc-curdl1]|uniref:Metal ABC transporter permease n=1 Tax=Natronosalvus hydrolyticus TaxID=2979988 RepID=A0AAP2Z5M2_9EURY|nr:metal ABC transporter permease [Halobacteria archaeon AArc-curdl1]
MTDNVDTTVARETDSGRDIRRLLELAGLAVTGTVSLVMIAFIVLFWLQEQSIASGAYEQFMIAGQWLDHYLGTNVFKWAFMWQQLAMGVLIGIVAPLIGTFLVHREMALIGETLAHTAFAGVAIGFAAGTLVGINVPLYFALVVSILGALGVQWLSEHTDTYGDVPVAIMLTGSFAVGTLVISWGRGQRGISIEGFLWGDLSIVTASSARLMAVLSVIVVAVVIYTYKQLVFITFDEQAARVARLNVTAYNTILVVMTAVVVVGSMQVLGVILVAGMLVIPVAAASQIAHGFRETMYLSVLFGQLSIVGGLAMAINYGLPSGGSIIVVAIVFYLATIGLSSDGVRSLSMH